MQLVIFDVDGTLVDSQATIVACAQAAFAAEGLEVPSATAVRRIVGLTLPIAMSTLHGEPDSVRGERLAEHYREAFMEYRARPDFAEPLFEGAREIIAELEQRQILLGVATGKAMRGLRTVLERHGLEDRFVTLQTADLHPSKPHPAMVLAALAETGVAPGRAMLVGDTSFDMEMAKAAGVRAVGVAWGNHPPAELLATGADPVLQRFEELLELL